jgi:hypothetical protein
MNSDLVEVQGNPLAVYQSLVAQGTDPDKLAKLLDLQERWERNQAVKAFSIAKLECKSELPVVVRDKKGDKGMYPSLEHVSREIDPFVTKHGFTHDFGTKTSQKDNCITVTLTVSHRDGHSEVRELVDIPHDTAGPKGTPNKSAVQGLVSSTSFAQRKLKLMYWDITVADEDRDGAAPTEKITEAEVESLRTMLMETGSDIARFCKAYAVERIEDLPKSQLMQARAQINRKAKQ